MFTASRRNARAVFLRGVLGLVLCTLPLLTWAQTKLYVVNAGADSISVVELKTGAVVKTISGPGRLNSIAYNAGDGLLYVPTHEGTGKVYLLDPSTDTFTGNPITVGPFPSYITVSPDGRRAYVSNQFGAVSVIDTQTRAVVSELGAVNAPVGTALSPLQSKLYVVNNQTAELSVFDAASNQTLGTLAIGCFNPLDIKADPVVRKAYVTKTSCPEIAVLSTDADSFVKTIQIPGPPRRLPQYIAVDSASHRAFVTLLSGHPEKGEYGAVAVIDTIEDRIVDEIPVGTHLARMALDPTDDLLFVTDRRDDRILVVDTIALRVIGQVPVGSDPLDIAIVPGR